MTIPPRGQRDPFDPSRLAPSHGVLALRTLRYLAAVTRLHDNARWYLRGWIKRRPDSAGEHDVTIPGLKRLKDERMRDLLIEAARDLGTAASLDNFKTTFNKVKDFRDHLVHAPFINLLGDTDEPVLGIPHYRDEPRVKRLVRRQSRVSANILDDRERELLWLLDVIQWLAHESGLRLGPGALGTTPSEPPRVAP